MRMRNEKIVTTVGCNIYKLRKQHGLSQTELALELGIDPSDVSKYERGTREMKIGILHQIANFFGVSFDMLFKTDECHPCLDDISHLFEFLNEEGQETVLKVLKVLAETPSFVKAENWEKTP